MNKPTSSPQGQGRLPATVVPEHYDLEVVPDLPGSTFTGTETITVQVHSAVQAIVLNSAEITISKAVIRNAAGTSFDATVGYDPEAQQVMLVVDGSLGKGKWFVDLAFAGILDPKLRGFYRCSFKDNDGVEHLLATTKFEPSDARRAFPCFDEPSFKATFSVSMVVDANLTALSNMAVESETSLDGGKKRVRFEPSIKMSSYLVFYAVGPFESSPVVKVGNTELRIWSAPGKQKLREFPMEAAVFSLTWLADYFGVPYPSRKLDLIAVPNFASGAMENYGGITFRETALLIDPARASQADLERVAEVVAHEIAHMWFGDLVTMIWWNGLWLNEAFATFLAAKVMEAFRPEWKFWEKFNSEKAAAMRVDGLTATRTIEFPVATPEDARSMFDVLTYEKGCAILRMLELYIGEETMRDGMRRYVKRHLYANTETKDLWLAIAEAVSAAGKQYPVETMMDGWVFQSGYPLVTVERSDKAGCFKLSQKKFSYLGTTDSTKWHIPVNIRALTRDGWQSQTVELKDASQTVYVGEEVSLVVVNAAAAGFFRVNYADDLRSALFENLSELAAPERFNLVADLWALVQGGEVPLREYLLSAGTLCSTFGERDPNVWSVVLGSIVYLRRMLGVVEPEVVEGLVNLTRGLAGRTLARLGYEPLASAHDEQLRASIVSTLGTLGDTSVRERAQQLFEEYAAGKDTVSANLVPAVVESVAAAGDEQAYERMIALRGTAPTPQEETRYLMSLATFAQAELVDRTLAACLDGTVRTQDVPSMLLKLMLNPNAGQKTWAFVKANWQTLAKLLPLQGMIRLLDGLPGIATASLEAEARNFFAVNTVKGSEKALAQNLELMSVVNRLADQERGSFQELLLVGYATAQR